MDRSCKPIKIVPGDELHLTVLGVPFGFNFLMGKDRQDMLAFGQAVWQASRKQALESASQEAATWKGAKLLLHAGEMTMQEKRTATAVALGIASAIRSLEGSLVDKSADLQGSSVDKSGNLQGSGNATKETT